MSLQGRQGIRCQSLRSQHIDDIVNTLINCDSCRKALPDDLTRLSEAAGPEVHSSALGQHFCSVLAPPGRNMAAVAPGIASPQNPVRGKTREGGKEDEPSLTLVFVLFPLGRRKAFPRRLSFMSPWLQWSLGWGGGDMCWREMALPWPAVIH